MSDQRNLVRLSLTSVLHGLAFAALVAGICSSAQAQSFKYKVLAHIPVQDGSGVSLTSVGNIVYGAASTDSSNPFGDIFSLSPLNGKSVMLGSFNGDDGGSPDELVAMGDRLYGTTMSGGQYG